MNIFKPSEIIAKIGRRKIMDTFIYKRNNKHCNHISLTLFDMGFFEPSVIGGGGGGGG